MGPPKVGKSTLIRCLIKNYTRQKLSDICGPVTIVSGKKRRLTLIECNNDINSMIDLAKVADLVSAGLHHLQIHPGLNSRSSTQGCAKNRMR
uniref:Uncharacterized protein n=1 Tax=Cyprinus carpio TaxID=7962 RepID=A0A8C2FFN6_CYPCA